jgi:hypothetical protein
MDIQYEIGGYSGYNLDDNYRQEEKQKREQLKKLDLYTIIPENMLYITTPKYHYATNNNYIHKFTMGLNILNNPINKDAGAVYHNFITVHGFPFAMLENIHKLYRCSQYEYSLGHYICKINIPIDDEKCDISQLFSNEPGKTNMIIIEKMFNMSDPNTYISLNIPMLDAGDASSNGYIDVLEWIKNNYPEKLFEKTKGEWYTPMDSSKNSKTLEWWKNNGLILDYTTNLMDDASFCSNYDILEWLKNSGLILKYSEHAMAVASAHGNIEMLNWWKNSGLQLKYNEETMNIASKNGRSDSLLWWINSGLELKYSEEYIIDICKTYNSYYTYTKGYEYNKVFQWWIDSGLIPIENFSIDSIDLELTFSSLSIKPM